MFLNSPNNFVSLLSNINRMDIVYNVNLFNWREVGSYFYVNESSLYPSYGDYKHPFPNGRKQFSIMNGWTGCFRRFRFLEVCIFNGNNSYVYVSEDNIGCIVSTSQT